MNQRRKTLTLLLLMLTAASSQVPANERVVPVGDDASLRQALAEARPGTRIVIASGRYRPGISASNLRGTGGEPIVIEGANPKDKPLLEGGSLAIHLSNVAHVTLRNLAVKGQTGNGINIDDGGKLDMPSHHVTLDGLHVSEIGPTGNRDGIKLSGVDDLVVRNCAVEGWAGQGIDMVGCHRVLIEACTFRGKPGFAQQIAVQAKGGSSAVTVRNCTFLNVGQRGVNLGGSTNLKLFRPSGAKYEAKDITVEGCRFVGGMAPVAFVGVDGAVVRYNTIYRPERWIVRILQENTEPGYVESRNGRFERNLIVYQRARVQSPVNVGGNTEPATFSFRENLWFCEDDAKSSRPHLPAPEQGGLYGTDPKVSVDDNGVPTAPSAGAARGYGANAMPAVQ